MKKTLLAVALIFICSFVAFGAGSQEASKADVEKVVAIWRDFGQVRDTPMSQKMHDLIVERVGIDIERVLVPWDQMSTKTTLMIASGEQLDFTYIYRELDRMPFYQKGLVHDLTDMADTYAPNMLKYYPPGSDQYEMATYKGRLYSVPFGDKYRVWNAIYIRPDWLKTAGLAMPTTIEEYENALDAFYNGRFHGGSEKVSPLSAGHDPLTDITTVLADFYLPGGREWWLDTSGKLMPPEAHPNYELMLAKLAEWYDMGYFARDLFASKIEQRREAATQNLIGSYIGAHTSLQTSGLEVLHARMPEADFTIVPAMKGLEGAANAYRQNNTSVHGALIFATCIVPERVLKFFDMHFAYADNYEFLAYGIEGESFERDGGNYNFLGGGGPKDWKAAPYYYGWNYFVSGSPALDEHRERYPYSEDEYIAWWAQREGELSMNIEVYQPVDVKVSYDQSKFKSESRLNDLKTFFDENKAQIISGEASPDSWPSVYAQWLKIGGSDLIEDKTAQFKAFISQ